MTKNYDENTDAWEGTRSCKFISKEVEGAKKACQDNPLVLYLHLGHHGLVSLEPGCVDNGDGGLSKGSKWQHHAVHLVRVGARRLAKMVEADS